MKSSDRFDPRRRGVVGSGCAALAVPALLTSVALARSTNRIDTVVARLNRDGVGIEEDWLQRIGPAHFSHINFRGTFRFNVERYAVVLVERAAGRGSTKLGP